MTKLEIDRLMNYAAARSKELEPLYNKTKQLLDSISSAQVELIQSARKIILEEHTQRAAVKGSIKCPRCYKHHFATLNYDKLCNDCVHIMCKEFPEDPVTKEIKINLETRGLLVEDNPCLL